MIDGLWTSASLYIGYGCVWQDESGKEKLLGFQNSERHLSLFAYKTRCTYLIFREYASILDISVHWDILQRYHLNDSRSGSMAKLLNRTGPSFSTEPAEIAYLQGTFRDFKITQILRAQNRTENFLAKIAQTFYRHLNFVG